MQGLEGVKYTNSLNDSQGTAAGESLVIEGETDRIFHGAPSSVTLEEPGRTVRLDSKGFPDLVVWNPGSSAGSKIKDLEPKGHDRFLCVEPAVISTPVELAVGNTWEGIQILTVGGA